MNAATPRPAKRRRLLGRAAAISQGRDRELLREMASLAERADPEELAALVTQIESTLKSCRRIELFFRRYVQALSRRRAH